MRIVDLKTPTKDYEYPGDCGLCLGFFDGVHLGHQALIRKLQEENKKREHALPLGALCFTSSPKDYFSPTPTPLLTPLPQKLEKLRQAGLRFAVLYDFPEIRDLDAFDFVKDILIKTLRCRLLVCGYNFTFGKDAKGTPKELAQYFGSQPNRSFFEVPAVKKDGQAVSASLIRMMLNVGYPEAAARLLGTAYAVTGKVRDGRHVGRTLGVPTANMYFENGYLVPRHGVYITTIKVDGRTYSGISNVGIRPTFDCEDGVNCESFLFDFSGTLYQKNITVSFLRFIRQEKKFETSAALREQIQMDINSAKKYFDGHWY